MIKKMFFPIAMTVVLMVLGLLVYVYLSPAAVMPGKLAAVPSTPVSMPVVSAPIAQPIASCPAGFVMVPGNPAYGTTDFCVMKYDAKCASTSDLSQGLEPVSGSCAGTNGNLLTGTYRNNGKGCACTGDKQVVSTASGFPITYIPEADGTANSAKIYCEAQGSHLLTNNEWMTIARNIEQVNANWCNKNGTNCGAQPGAAGMILANGHNDANNQSLAGAGTNGALIAGNDDQACYGTTTDGSNQCGGKSSQKRTLALSNGTIVWDLAGNVWQWVDAEIPRNQQPQSRTSGKLDQGWMWSEFAPGGLGTVITDDGSPPSLGYDAFRPTNPAWNSTNGVGRIYHYSASHDTNTTLYTFIRGGNWRHGYDSGAFCIHLSPVAAKTNIDDVGFRCSSPVMRSK